MKERRNSVFIAKSLDGFIADRSGGISYLEMVPNPDQVDMGYSKFIDRIDAIVMGRNTYEKVLSFDIGWPYTKPVYLLSSSLTEVDSSLVGRVELLNGSVKELLKIIHSKGHHRLYIDGGTTIHNFLKEDLIDELILTTFPILLGGGSPLFSDLPKSLAFEHIESNLYLGEIIQNSYSRKR